MKPKRKNTKVKPVVAWGIFSETKDGLFFWEANFMKERTATQISVLKLSGVKDDLKVIKVKITPYA